VQIAHPITEATMAQRVSVELEDDLDGGPADETLRFGLGGLEYEIDLSKKNASRFRRQIAPYIEHARQAGRGQRRRPGRTASSRERSGDIRAWAKHHGIAVSERGRIPASVVEQYQAATTGV
jgi:Lsr2